MARGGAVLGGGETVARGACVDGARVHTDMVLPGGYVLPELQLNVGRRWAIRLAEPHCHCVTSDPVETVQCHAASLQKINVRAILQLNSGSYLLQSNQLQ